MTMNNKNTAGSIKIFDFKLYYRAIVMKSAWFWHKSKYKDKKNRIKNIVISSYIFSLLWFSAFVHFFLQRIKTTHWRNMVLGKPDIYMEKNVTESLAPKTLLQMYLGPKFLETLKLLVGKVVG